MKRVRRVLCFLVLFIAISQLTIHIANDHIAKELEHKLRSCPLPTDAQLLDSASIAGKMEGNGNGMQWFGVMLIKSSMSEEELTEWFEQRVAVDEGTEYIWVMKQDTPTIFGDSHFQFQNYSDANDCYQIRLARYSVAGMESSLWEQILNGDLRGH